MDIKDMTLIGHFSVDSGQAMVGDPCYLDNWETNRDETWDIEGKEGQYSYYGVSATTLKNHYGEIGNARAVAFTTGYGDGYYPVYAELNNDGYVSRIVIDFIGDEE